MKSMLRLMMIAGCISSMAAVTVFADASASDVLNDLHQSNQTEIRMGQLAEQKGNSSDVRDYGKTLVDDHQKADEKVMKIAQNDGINLKSAEPGMMEKMETKKLEDVSGTKFDNDFSKMMVKDHKDAISKLQKAQKSTSLPSDVRDLVADVLPTLQKHLETAQKIYDMHKNS